MNHAMLGRPPRPTNGRKPTAAMRQYVLERDNYTCKVCGCSDAERRLDVDHIVPWCRGGRTAEPNLRACCWKCNNEKSDRLPTPHDLSA